MWKSAQQRLSSLEEDCKSLGRLLRMYESHLLEDYLAFEMAPRRKGELASY